MILCDTNIIIEVYRGNKAVKSELENIGQAFIAVSDITRAELFYGARNKQELQNIKRDTGIIHTLPVEREISAMAVKLVESYCLSYKMNIEDALIAATALYYDMELFTLNLKDFVFIPGIRLYRFTKQK